MAGKRRRKISDWRVIYEIEAADEGRGGQAVVFIRPPRPIFSFPNQETRHGMHAGTGTRSFSYCPITCRLKSLLGGLILVQARPSLAHRR